MARLLPWHAELRNPQVPSSMVLAKVESYPHWPGYIGADNKYPFKTHNGQKMVHVFFLGEYNSAWVSESNILKFSPSLLNELKVKQSEAIENMTAREKEAFSVAELEAEDQYKNGLVCMEADEDQLRLNDIVIVRFKVYPEWPAIIETSQLVREWSEGNLVHCRFFGKKSEYAWVRKEDVVKYTEDRMKKVFVPIESKEYANHVVAKFEAQKEGNSA